VMVAVRKLLEHHQAVKALARPGKEVGRRAWSAKIRKVVVRSKAAPPHDPPVLISPS
jgi:hypothetical protein